MYYTQLNFLPEKGRLENQLSYLVKTEFPQTTETLFRMLHADTGMAVEDMRGTLFSVSPISEKTANTKFNAKARTIRRHDADGDWFVEPVHASTVLIELDGDIHMASVPACAVNDDCTGDATRRVLRDAVAACTGKSADDVTWGDYIDIPLHHDMSAFGIEKQNPDIMLFLSGRRDGLIMDDSKLDGKTSIPSARAEQIKKFLNTPGLQDGGDSPAIEIRFRDGMRLEIKCVPEKDKLSYVEAALVTPYGETVAWLPPKRSLDGPWTIEHEGRTYTGSVKITPDTREFNILADKAYEQYKLKWMASHGHTLKSFLLSVSAYAAEIPSCSGAESHDLVAEWEANAGFNGELYKNKSEFLASEYENWSYMSELLSPDDFETWQAYQLHKGYTAG